MSIINDADERIFKSIQDLKAHQRIQIHLLVAEALDIFDKLAR